MTHDEITKLYLLACAATGAEPSKITAEAWRWLLSDLQVEPAEHALKMHLRASKWMPKPAEVVEMVERLTGAPPSLDAAVGMFQGGDLDGHPAVREAAKRVYNDPRCADPQARKQALFDFRAAYQAVLWREESARLAPEREALAGGPIAELVAGRR